ncbi:hypothetical protein [Paracoccus liaowanqingii]|nr:hypothetical protein [Paracoccus liaowanqingii]
MTPYVWTPAPPDEAARMGDEDWPLLDELLARVSTVLPDPDRQERRAALQALINAAFGR